MKLLVIASVLPVPGFSYANDIIFKFLDNYLKKYPDEIRIIHPEVKSGRILSFFGEKYRQYYQINKLKQFKHKDITVDIFPYLTKRANPFLTALISRSIILLNRRRIKKIIREFKPDLVHAQYMFPDAVLAQYIKEKYSIPFVLTLRSESRFLENRLAKRIFTTVCSNASYIQCLNYGLFEKIRSMKLSVPVELLPHGIEIAEVSAGKKTKNKVLKIISICQLIPLKNIDKVLQALADLKKYDFEYHIVGEGPERSELEKKAVLSDINDRVIFHGKMPHENINEILSGMDIFILASFPETFGRVYFEAMNMGLPVICSNNAGIQGYYKEGVEALGVDGRNIEEVRSALERLLTDDKLRENLGENGKKLVRRYSMDSMIEKWRIIYSDTIRK